VSQQRDKRFKTTTVRVRPYKLEAWLNKTIWPFENVVAITPLSVVADGFEEASFHIVIEDTRRRGDPI